MNAPVHSVDGDTDPMPFSPMGFADIAGGLRGSRQSLDRAPDDRPGPVRGSNRSLNRSQDSATAAAGNPRTRGRDAAAARDSNRSLNRSVTSSTVGATSWKLGCECTQKQVQWVRFGTVNSKARFPLPELTAQVNGPI